MMTSNLSNSFGNFGPDYKVQFHIDDMGNGSFVTEVRPIDPLILNEDNNSYIESMHWHIDNLLVYELEDFLIGDVEYSFGVSMLAEIFRPDKKTLKVKFPILDRTTAYATMLHFSIALTGGIINSVKVLNDYYSIFDLINDSPYIAFNYSTAALVIGYEDNNLSYLGLENDGYFGIPILYDKELYFFCNNRLCKLEWYKGDRHEPHFEHVQIGLLNDEETIDYLLKAGTKL